MKLKTKIAAKILAATLGAERAADRGAGSRFDEKYIDQESITAAIVNAKELIKQCGDDPDEVVS